MERLESADWLTLSADERIEWTGRPSLFTIAPQLGLAVAVGVGGALVVGAVGAAVDGPLPAVIRLLPLLGASVLLAVVLLRWYRVRYVITTTQVYIKRGFLSLDVDRIRIARIQNTQLSQSLVERLLGYGDVTAYTAGSDTLNIEFRAVPTPARVDETLSRLLSRPENEPTGVL
ncbi:PH domain-containing protein [Halohasta salina]|uniref:PH domain-containing protein n=1 Tax=Halohasta salina TaxID=2961621 RepID=UPI0020A2F639|nr:PH domain-containing protein [Halohasta salina]